MIISLRKLNKLISKLSLFLLLMIAQGVSVSQASEKEVIRFGVLSIAQPSRIYANWQPFADYMTERIGKPVEIVVPRGFGKMAKTIVEGKVDFFYINSHVFYRLKQEGKAVAVAQMKNIVGKTTSTSDVFVKKGSGIKTISDLKGKSIAFVSPMGAGGYLAPRAYLYKSGLKSGVDNREVFTKNLSNSIHGVLLGDYDAASMCGVNYKLMNKKIEMGELKIIAASDAYPENVIGARKGLSENIIEKFRQEVVSMEDSPDGVELLDKMASMKIMSFVEYDPSAEEMTKKLLEEGEF